MILNDKSVGLQAEGATFLLLKEDGAVLGVSGGNDGLVYSWDHHALLGQVKSTCSDAMVYACKLQSRTHRRYFSPPSLVTSRQSLHPASTAVG